MSSPVIGYVVRSFPHPTQTFIANEMLALNRLGLQIHVFSYRGPEAPPDERFRGVGIQVAYLPDPINRHIMSLARAKVTLLRRHPRRFARTVAYVARHTFRERNADTWRRLLQALCLAAAAEDAGITQLHAHFADGPTRVAMLASMLTGISYSFTGHARDIYRDVDKGLLGEKIASACWVATCTRVNYEHLRSIAGTADRDKVRLSYHGVDLEKFRPPASAPGGVPLVLSVGRLVEKKGFPDLIDACRVLQDAAVAFRCQIIGTGQERTRLERQIDALGLRDVVTLSGAYSQDELVEQYQRATVFALPSHVVDNGDRDGIPNTLIEAMACGLPVVSTSISGIPELVEHERTGLLVQPDAHDEVAAAIDGLLRDPDLRKRLGTAARTKVERDFDWNQNALELYRWFAPDVRVEPALTR